VIGPASDTPVGEAAGLRKRPLRHRVSPRAIWYWAVRAACGWVLVVIAEVVWMLLPHDGMARWHVLGVLATLVVAAGHLVVMPQWRFHVHRWEATAHAVYTQAGWFDQQRRIAPISRIQTVDTERGPLEQVFGLSNVTVTTASAAGPLRIVGLDRDTAQRLVDGLASTAGLAHGDAT